MDRTIHVIGAGLAGLSATVRLVEAGQQVTVHEAARQAGGRCRSYRDRALGIVIDNGNHVILSGNRAALSFLETIGARHRLCAPVSASFLFVDAQSGERWELKLGSGRLPWWILSAARRLPRTRAREYLAFARLLWSPGDKTVGELVCCSGTVYDRLLQPILLAGLNLEPAEASAKLAAILLQKTIGAGGRSCRPFIAPDGLSATFAEPAAAFATARGGSIRFGQELRRVSFKERRVDALEFNSGNVVLDAKDAVILAVPPTVAARLVPGLAAPSEFRSIVNVHFRISTEVDPPRMIGVVRGLSQWIFIYRNRVSITISNANALLGKSRADLAREIWSEVSALAKLPADLPPWQVVTERRATFATTPEQHRRRPAARTRWANLYLAGDWTATGLPPTIEGAISSGRHAAQLVLR